MFARRVFAGWAIALLAASGVAQEHRHGKGEKLGAVHFATWSEHSQSGLAIS
jgi:hypothetical protein